MLDVLRITKQRCRNSAKKSQSHKLLTKPGENEQDVLRKIKQLEDLIEEEGKEDSQSEEEFADDELDGDEIYERID